MRKTILRTAFLLLGILALPGAASANPPAGGAHDCGACNNVINSQTPGTCQNTGHATGPDGSVYINISCSNTGTFTYVYSPGGGSCGCYLGPNPS